MKIRAYIFPILALLFSAFLAYVIYAANTGLDFIVFKWLKLLPYGDKIGHFFLIGSMCFILNLALKVKQIQIFKRLFLLGSLIMIVVVSLEEFSQLFMARRTFDLVDLFFNYLGIYVFGKLAQFLYPNEA